MPKTSYETYKMLAKAYASLSASAVEKYQSARNQADAEKVSASAVVRGNDVYIDGIIVDDGTVAIAEEFGEDAGFIGPSAFTEAINGPEGEINLFLNSPGGNVFDGVKMLTALETKASANKVNLIVDGLAASAATYMLFAEGLESRRITKMSQVMIHKAWSISVGNSEDMIKSSERLMSLDTAYAELMAGTMKQSAEEIMELMSAETWFTAEQAIETGLVNGLYSPAAESKNETESNQRARQLKTLNAAAMALLEG